MTSDSSLVTYSMNGDYFVPDLVRFGSYERARREFRWQIPSRFNIADWVCRNHRDAESRTALIEVKEAATNTYTFGAIDFLSDKVASALAARGVTPGDRVGVILQQSAALVVAHLGVLKLGGVVVPLSVSLDQAALSDYLIESSARVLIIDSSLVNRLREIIDRLPAPENLLMASERPGEMGFRERSDFWREVYGASSDCERAETTADTPAYIFYSPDSAGRVRGVIHSHSVMPARLTAFEMLNNLDVSIGTVFWAAGDWGNADALFNLLYPALFYGRPVIASVSDPTAEGVFAFLERAEITNAYLPAGNLEGLLAVAAGSRSRYDLKLRSVSSSGRSLGASERLRLVSELGCSVNESYGKTEIAAIAADCSEWFERKAGSSGRVVPGRVVKIIDAAGNVLPAGRTGYLAVHRSDPALFIDYTSGQDTAARFSGDWFKPGDRARIDEDGYLYLSES